MSLRSRQVHELYNFARERQFIEAPPRASRLRVPASTVVLLVLATITALHTTRDVTHISKCSFLLESPENVIKSRMAKSGPKKQLQENRSRLAFLRVLLIVTNVSLCKNP